MTVGPYETLIVDLSDDLLTVTLNRPDTLNAFTAVMKHELTSLFQDIQKGDLACRALLLTANGRGFCAGADLTEVDERGLDDLLIKTYHPMLETLSALDIPIIAAVNGVAAGAGLSFALHADFILASQSARFLMAFARIGLGPDAGASYLLPRLIGDQRARRMFMLGEQISAEDAETWGLVHACVPDDQLSDTARNFALQLAKGPTKSYAVIRQLMRQSHNQDYSTQLALEAKLQGELGATKDFIEGTTAFLEKRKAVFTGK